MVNISVTADVKQATKQLRAIQRKAVPLATAKALTFTAERAQRKATDTIPQVFSNPTPYTRKSIYKTSATVRNLTADIHLKDISSTRDHYLLTHIKGGRRPKGRAEKRLGGYWVPGREAKRNKYGNLTRGTWSKILADVGAFGQFTGDAANTKLKADGGKGVQYFIGRGKHGKRIIFKKIGKQILPWIVEVSTPKYRKRFSLSKIMRGMAKSQFRRLFDVQLKREIAKIK